MTAEGEAVADALTGAVAAGALEPEAGSAPSAGAPPRPACLNCGAALAGPYCASCGQSAHVHRSFRSLGHDILHSVFHFDGKLWRTIPELVLRPGRLTRRYIDGERAKFISPIALFLFTVFLMYAVFAFRPGIDWNAPPPLPDEGWLAVTEEQSLALLESTEEKIEALRVELEDPALSPRRRRELAQQMRDLAVSVALMRASVSGEGDRFQALRREAEAARASDIAEQTAGEETGSESRNAFGRALEQLEEDPELVLYKMKSNGYKWSWLLVPLSIPFVWVLFFWRREFRLYDHAVFVTYSISFMVMLLIVGTLADAVGVGDGVQAALMMLVPPLHMYRQLRGAYDLSRRAALVRLFLLLFAAAGVLAIFLTMLLMAGALE
ncbi:MAG: DUF3667 domain-containing protein [Gammaproteobacteria bacterium]|nr:DUF3667 domain-containing protein [Gammaproteobacteria bacterium]